jgi:hypothetical protein
VQDLQFITLLRDPVARAVSQYRFWIQKMGSSMTPQEFLEHPVSANLQVRKIAGRDDVLRAQRMIEDRFMLVGAVERFDEFLVLLARLLDMQPKQFAYYKKNLSSERGPLPLPEGFEARLAERNQLDRELYDWVLKEALPRFRRQAHCNLDQEIAAFRDACSSVDEHRHREWLDLAYRNLYMKPATGIIRFANGLSYSGTYAVPRGER